MTDTKRISYLDMARGIGMILVVMGHVTYINPNLRHFITAFHMPLFFLISGMLLDIKKEEEKNYILLLRKKLQRIMIPYVVFSLASFVIESTRILIKGLDEWNVVLRQLFQSCCLQGVSTLWFLPALLMSELLFVGIRKKTKHIGTILITIGIVVGCYLLNNYEQIFYQYHAVSRFYRLLHDVCSMIIRNLFCVGFIGIGYYMSHWLIKHIQNSIQVLVALLMCAAIGYIAIVNNGTVDLRFMQINLLTLYIFGSIGGGMTVVLLCKCMQRVWFFPFKRVLEFYGRNSLIIMVTHMDFRVLYISILVAQQIFNRIQVHSLFCILIVVLVFVSEIPLIWFINSYMPIILGKMKKSS